MPTLKFTAAAVNPPLLDRELRAAISAPYDGLSLSAEDGLLVYVTDGHDAEALRPAIAAVIAAHNPAVLTAEQQLEARRMAAALVVRTADVTAMRAGLEAKGVTVAQLQAQVAALAAMVEAMRVALGLGEPPDGRGNA